MNDKIINIVLFVFAYAFSYGICIIFSAKGLPERCVGRINVHHFVESVLFLKPCKYVDNNVPIFSLIHQIVLQIGLIVFLAMIIFNPSQPTVVIRMFIGKLFMTAIMITFFGFIICRVIYDKIHP
ncbi:MAG: hypothetical protein FWG61_08580 [Firmicutes bacterium]|nr:hypothetical protein [Bacillota bacterium]